MNKISSSKKLGSYPVRYCGNYGAIEQADEDWFKSNNISRLIKLFYHR